MKRFLSSKRIRTITQADPWVWIGLIFACQATASLLLSGFIGLSLREIGIPVFILFLGSLVALWFRYRSPLNERTFLQRWLPALLYMFFIFLLSHRSFDDISVPVSSNSFHPLEYATLGIFLSWAWCPVLTEPGISAFVLRVLSTGLLYGVSDEFHQSFVPGRFPSFSDFLLDFIGLSIGCSVFLISVNMRKRFRESHAFH